MRLAMLSSVILWMLLVPTRVHGGQVPPSPAATSRAGENLGPVKADRFAVALVFDAKTNRGPCGVDARHLEKFDTEPKDPSALESSLAKCRRMPLKDGSGYQLIILNPRFRADYAVTIVSQLDLGSGVIEPRGLATIAPLNLSVLGTPVAHGGRLPSTLTIAPITPAQILTQLLDPATMSQPLLTLSSQVRDLGDAYSNLQLEIAAMNSAITRIRGVPTCEAAAPGLTIEGLRACVDARTRYIAGDVNVASCTAGGRRWNAAEFDCVVNEIDRRIGDLSAIRGRLAEYNFVAVADRLDTEAAQLATKLGIFLQNVSVAAETMKDVQAMVGSTTALSQQSRAVLRDARRALIKKHLKDAYGAILDEKELNTLASDAADELTGPLVASRLGIIRGQLAGYLARPPFTDSDLSKIRTAAATSVTEVASAVDGLNQAFGLLFSRINDVYLNHPDPQPTHRPIDTSAGSGSNRLVFCKLTSDERFRLYQFTGVTPTVPVPAVGTGTLLTVTPNAALTASPANLPQNLDRRFQLELHKVWTANIVAGAVFSSLRDASFGLGTVSQNGHDVLVPILAGDQRPSPHYLIGFNYYLGPRDSFPGATKGADRWRPGALFGIGLETTKQFFVGANFEPTLGIDLAVGLHYGEQTALQEGYTAGRTPVPEGTGAAPTRSIMAKGVFVMLGFDLDIFRRFMGTAAPK
jgi:hypothetical protein